MQNMQKFLVDFLFYVVIAAFTALAVFEVRSRFEPHQENVSLKIAFVDSDALLREAMQIFSANVQSGNLLSEEMPTRGGQFGGELMNIIRSYSQNGYMVFRSDLLIAYPPQENGLKIVDITNDIRTKIFASDIFRDLEL